MRNKHSLDSLGKRIRLIDRMVIDALVARQRLAKQVGALKIENGQPIYRRDIEESRINDARTYGASRGLNPDFIAALLYAVIKESCMEQLLQREDGSEGYRPSHALSFEEQRKNLLALTELVAPVYDKAYALPFSTAEYLKYEDRILENVVIDQIPREKRGLFLDLGCATGKVTLRFAGHFESTIGYDLSPDMLIEARKKALNHRGRDIKFVEHDLDLGIPAEDNSAMFVTCSMGTGSEFRDLEAIASEVVRVLQPGGHFAFSFYNKNALLYQWPYVPWEVPLAARVDLDDECLDVVVDGKVFQTFARPYSADEVHNAFAKHGATGRGTYTHPTISPILPNEAFQGDGLERISDTMVNLDSELAFGQHGVYLLVTGEKNG